MTGLEIQCLPAQQGDALWVRWGDGRQLFVDMGTESTGRALATRFAGLPPERLAFDLLVVTHVDVDHIGGVLSWVADPRPDLPVPTFADLWFNGWEHLHGGQVPPPGDERLEPMGPAQGERLAGWLRERAWNEAFDRGPVVRAPGPVRTLELGDGLALTVLGPTQQRLEALSPVWQDEVEAALHKGGPEAASPGLGGPGVHTLESYGPKTPPILDGQADLAALAESPASVDPSLTNASSITLLLSWQGRRVLLAGDARAADVVEGLQQFAGPGRVPLDLVKVPHHGSRNNVSRELVEAVDCPDWLFSTDGSQFKHPDAIAVARILQWSGPTRPTLSFNVPSEYNGWWRDARWRERFGYDIAYGDDLDGITVAFDPA